MYKLLLVDDEEDVREGVIQEVDWSGHGFDDVQTAENGKEAIDLFERMVPDVVVTDIQMPFMDGLQLSEWIRDKYPTTKIIILTGFDEFEYAQKAVKLDIDEYVLKPFTSQDLLDALLKVRSRLESETAERENVHTLQEHYRQSLPVLRESFLAALIRTKLSRASIQDKSELYQIHLDGKGYAVSLISMDQRPFHTENHKELLLFAAYNIAAEIAQKHRLGIAFIHYPYVVLLTLSEESDPHNVRQRTLKVLEEIRQSVEKFLKFTVTIGVGTVSGDITDTHISYEDAVVALDYRLILGNNRVICIDDVEKRIARKVSFDELKEHALIRCIKVGSVQEMLEMVNELFRDIEGVPVSMKDYQIYVLEILMTVLKAAKDADLDLEGVFGADFAPFAEMYKFNNLQDVRAWIASLCERMMSSIASDRQYTYKSLVEQAKEYVRQHYQESDISIQHVCDFLHISTGYFSGIFKKETKMTFVAYLVHIRMEAAKELLRTTDLKAFEIADKVGYADPNYFSFCFRKIVGVSPKEYRVQS